MRASYAHLIGTCKANHPVLLPGSYFARIQQVPPTMPNHDATVDDLEMHPDCFTAVRRCANPQVLFHHHHLAIDFKGALSHAICARHHRVGLVGLVAISPK